MASPHENQLSTSADELVASDKQDVNGYDEFMSWRKSWNINSFSEEVVMEFFREAAETLTPEALHTLFSTLRAGMLSNHNVNIANFVFLRGGVAVPVSNGSSKGFSDEEINKFLTEAPDAEYLATKAATVIGLHADCPFADLRNIAVNMVKDHGTEITVHIPKGRKNLPKVHSISGEFANILRKYLQVRLRTTKITTDKLLLHYHEGKCGRSQMGKNSVAKMPRKIADFLKLDDPDYYTPHSFRKTYTRLAGKGLNAVDTAGTSGRISNPSSVGMDSATNSSDCMTLSQDVAESIVTDRARQFNSLDSGSNDDQHVIQCVDQNARDIITTDCITVKQHNKTELDSDVEFVDLTAEPNGTIDCPGSITNEIVSMSCNDVTHLVLQTKLDVQEKELARLKELTDQQSSEIRILKDLLEKSTEQSVKSRISRMCKTC